MTTLLTAITLSVLFATRLVGLYSHQVLSVTLCVGLSWGVISRLWWWKTNGLSGRLRQAGGPHLFQARARAYFWFILGLTTLTTFPRTSEMMTLIIGVAMVWLVVLGLQLLQPAQINRGPTIIMLIGAGIMTLDIAQALRPTVDPAVRISTPFKGEWIVLQGGHSPLHNHHLSAYNQKYALDLVKLNNGMIFKEIEGDSMTSGLWCWEAPLYSPVDGVVALIRDDMEDSESLNMVSERGDAIGNHVIIKMEDGHYVVFAHMRQGSVQVSEGQSVSIGDPIGETGNSGNTTISHLHLQVQTHKDLWDPDNRSVPFTFGDGLVYRRNDRVVGVLNEAE